MKKAVFILCVFSACYCYAQDGTVNDLKKASQQTIKKDDKDTTLKVWKKGGNFALTLNQGSLSNWAAGGDKFSLSLNSMLDLYAFYKKGKHSWDNSLGLAYGFVNTTSLGQRKASDRIDLLTKYGYALNSKLNLAGLFNLRSQFANGYGYAKNVLGVDSAYLTSKTFAPAYVLLSPGIDWRPKDNFSLFVSPVTARWVIVGSAYLRPFYGVPVNKPALSEMGAFASANYQATFNTNLGFKSKLDLFSNYKHNPQNIDVYWANMFTAQITKYINFNLNVDVIYDDDTKNIDPKKGPAPQILQMMGIGFAYHFKN
ncbi:MAG: hypothetical protein ABS68_01780 [Niastella sp. SCN 39-18]|nr:DUF3078 domain-containing protein [Sphingobacteriales bacterium]ODT54522.1 MAG: hypothetical protein ABS68_01780 [Niastella sp. SCN 39-18]OJW10785.1 MAG: hypothetical protein BGO53_14550 [Sphingobacteriales bacterium 39-19]